MVSVKCLYCDADNDPRATGGYCDSCGKKLPPASAFRARRPVGGESATDVLVGAEPASPRRRTAEALFTAALLSLVGGGLFLVLGPLLFREVPQQFAPAVMAAAVVGLAAFAATGLWARYQPLPAAVAALVLFGALTVAMFVVHTPGAVRGLPVNLVVLVFLVRGLLVSARDRL
jgi:hypothetical protein